MTSMPVYIDEEGNAAAADIAYSVDHLRAMVKQLQEMEFEVKELNRRKKKMIDDYVDEYRIPKKEVMSAIKMLKSDTDPMVTQEIYKEIADLIED